MGMASTIKKTFASALAGAFLFSSLPFFSVFAKSDEHPREKLASFSTYFSETDKGRCANIALAAARIDGIALQPYGDFSFNACVGERTAEKGYKQAKIIVNGEYVLGVGGGVCQVSTTLYNLALLAGLTVAEFHPHSLCVGYVAPSRDAMVSSESDLKLFNPLAETVYLSVVVSKGAITATAYGKKDGFKREIECKELERTPPPAPEIKDGEKDEILRYGKDGVKSECYLKTYQNGVLVSVKRLRIDKYLPTRGIIIKKTEKPTKNLP